MEEWKTNYFMNKSEWKKPYFHKLIGGIKSTTEEKETCINQIKEAIKNNNRGRNTLLSKDILLKAYPESLELFPEYYQSLNNAYQGKRVFSEDKYTMTLIYAPILAFLSLDELYTYMEKLQMSFRDMNKMLVLYKRVISQNERLKKDITKDGRYDLSLIKQMMKEYINSDLNAADMTKKYRITSGTFSTYVKEIKENDPELYEEVKASLAHPVNNKWKYKYDMKKYEWNSEYFKNLVGGISTTTEEKQACIEAIKNAISKNKNGEVTELSKEIFLKSYPESINLLQEYYDSLIDSHKKSSHSQYQQFNQYFLANNKTWEEVLTHDRDTMLFIYSPYLASISPETLSNYAKKFGLNLKVLTDMIDKYKQTVEKEPNQSSEDKSYDLKIVRQIANEILINNVTKLELIKKYNLSTYAIDKYIEKIKEIDKDAYQKVKEILKHNREKHIYQMNLLLPALFNLIAQGMQVGENKVPFTMLDFYSISGKNVQEVTDYIKSNQNKPEVQPYKNRILRFFNNERNVGPLVSAESMAKNGIAITYHDERHEFDEAFCEKIINYLKENNIPTNYSIVYTAARRFIRGEEVLPLLNSIPDDTPIMPNVKTKTPKQ